MNKEKRYYVGIRPSVFNRLKNILSTLKQERETIKKLKRDYEKSIADYENSIDNIYNKISELEGKFNQLSETFFDFKDAIKKDILNENMKLLKKELNKEKGKIRKESLSYSYYVSLLNILFNINACSSEDYHLISIYLKTLDMLVNYLVENNAWKFLKQFCIDYLKDLRSKWVPLNQEVASLFLERIERYSSL